MTISQQPISMKTDIASFTREIENALDAIFEKAKSRDEFEYVRALIRFQGVAQVKKGLELLHVTESKRIIEDITQNFLNKKLPLYTKVR